MTELSFLIDLLLNQKLPKPVRDLISIRIKEVETTINSGAFPRMQRSSPPPSIQSASTLALLEKHGPLPTIEMPPVPVEEIAQTPQTAAALVSRQEAISNSMTGKVEKGRTSPRKW